MPQLPYKFYGSVYPRSNTQNAYYATSEYNNFSTTSMVRINDCYIYCPALGEDVTNAVIWTPSFRRVNINNGTGVSQVTELTNFSIEEIVPPFDWGLTTTTPSNFNANRQINRFRYSTLQTAGVTMYIKRLNEPNISGEAIPTVRDLVTGASAIQQIRGICFHNGAEIVAGIGNGFTLSYNDAFCIGLRMDKPCGTTLASRGRYYYYLVNRNSNNDGEIVWRIVFNIGLSNLDSHLTTGTTLPYGTYFVANPVPYANAGITIGNTYYLCNTNQTTDRLNFSVPGNISADLAIDYANIYDPAVENNPYGTDPLASGQEPQTDYRPYIINSVPVS